ncbi:MAG: BatA and WFA domain-containing protein [Planctomycetaceae bacterium]
MFANSWAILIGLTAAAAPVIVHWLTKPKPVRLPVSTLRFIRGAVQQRRARYRLRDLLVLMFRTAAILLLAFAIARPLLHRQATASATDTATANVTRIVLLDCSQSMAARDGGIVRFERARPIVSNLLKYQPSMKANLLLSAASPQPVFDGPTTNLGALRDALSDAAVRPERLRVQQALNHIAEMFDQTDADSRIELVIVSDFQRSNWATADFSVLPESCQVELQSVASSDDAPNLAVLDLTVAGRAEAGHDADVSVRIGNYSDTPRHARVEVTLGNVVIPFEGHCPAKTQTSIGGRVPIASDGWHIGSARLMSADDALPADDAIPVAIQAFPQPKIAVLTRDDTDRAGTTAYFVKRALSSTVTGSTTTGGTTDAVFTVDAADPDVELLRQAEVVVAARPGRLTGDSITVLTAMLQRGHSVLYIAADQLDAANLRDLTGALGSSVRMPVEYLPQPGSRSGVRRFLTDVDRRRSPFAIFGDELASAIGSLEFSGGLVTRSTSEGLQDDVRATLNDQSAFLTVTSVGRGRLAVMNADLDRSNLARTPVLVPLLGELISQDLGMSAATPAAFPCGEPLALQLPIGEENIDALTVVGPTADLPESAKGTFSPVPAGIVWEITSAGPVGVYEVRLHGRTVAAAVTSVPVEEADLRSLSADVFEGRLSGGRTLTYADGSIADTDSQDDTWVWLAALCVGCVLMEILTLKVFQT